MRFRRHNSFRVNIPLDSETKKRNKILGFLGVCGIIVFFILI